MDDRSDFWTWFDAHARPQLGIRGATFRAMFQLPGPLTIAMAEVMPGGADAGHHFLNAPTVGGKGRLIAEYADAVGASLEFAQYQAGWTRLVP